MTDRARELVAQLREEARTIQSFSSIMVDPRATLLCKAADFIEQSLTPPEGDTVSGEVVERVARALHDEALARGETGSRRSWEKITIEEREGFRNLARAALSAIDSENERLREALEYIVRQDGKGSDGLIDWQRCVDRIQEIARAALSSPPAEGEK